MLTREELLSAPNYLLTLLQLEIFRQVEIYICDKNITKQELATASNSSVSFINMVLNGNCNCSLSKLIELSLAIGKVPVVSFIPTSEYGVKDNLQVSGSFEDLAKELITPENKHNGK